jgi:UDP-glucose 4-epimerase
LIELLEAEFGVSLERDHLPTREGDVRDSQADSTLLRDLFPDITPVDLASGLRETVEWMKTRSEQR